MADDDKRQDAEDELDEELDEELEDDAEDDAEDDDFEGDDEADDDGFEADDGDDDGDDIVDAVYDGDDDDDERSASVAKALGVGEDGEDEAEEDQKAPVNRAQRRRQQALRRRGGQRHARQAGDGDEADGADEPPAKDRNARRRAALLRRRRAAAEEADDEQAPDKLLPSEMVDDALARSGAATVKMLKRHWSTIQWVLVVIVVGAGGYLYYSHHSKTAASDAAHGLAAAVEAEEATVIPEDVDERTEEQKKFDVRDVYGTVKEREEAVLKGYRQVITEHGGTGASILARLGEGGVMLDRREWDQAIAAYDEVLGSKLAPADPDVQARALEGKGFAMEGKGDLDAALKTFEKLGAVAGDGFPILAQYHQARVLLAKEQKDRAKELLVEARTKLEKATLDVLQKPKLTPLGLASVSPYRWLQDAVDEELRAIDPSAVPPAKPSFPGGGKLTPEQIKQLLQQQGAQPGIPER